MQSHAALVVALREAEAVRDELTGIGSDRQRRLIHEQLPQSIIMTLMQHRTLSTSRSGDAAVIQSPVRHKLLTNVNGIDAVEAFRKALSNSSDSIPRSCAGISCEELSSVHAVCAAACPSTTDLDQLHESPASPEVIECKQILGKAATTLLDKQYSAAQAQYNAARVSSGN